MTPSPNGTNASMNGSSSPPTKNDRAETGEASTSMAAHPPRSSLMSEEKPSLGGEMPPASFNAALEQAKRKIAREEALEAEESWSKEFDKTIGKPGRQALHSFFYPKRETAAGASPESSAPVNEDEPSVPTVVSTTAASLPEDKETDGEAPPTPPGVPPSSATAPEQERQYTEMETAMMDLERQDREYVEGFWTAYDDIVILSLFSQMGILCRLAASLFFSIFSSVFRNDSALFINLPLNCLSCFFMGTLASGESLMEIVSTRFTPPRLQQEIHAQTIIEQEQQQQDSDDGSVEGGSSSAGGGLRRRRPPLAVRRALRRTNTWIPKNPFQSELREVQLLALERRIRASPCLVLFPIKKQDVDVVEDYFFQGYQRNNDNNNTQDGDDEDEDEDDDDEELQAVRSRSSTGSDWEDGVEGTFTMDDHDLMLREEDDEENNLQHRKPPPKESPITTSAAFPPPAAVAPITRPKRQTAPMSPEESSSATTTPAAKKPAAEEEEEEEEDAKYEEYNLPIKDETDNDNAPTPATPQTPDGSQGTLDSDPTPGATPRTYAEVGNPHHTTQAVPHLDQIISNVATGVTQKISRMSRVNLADGWDVGTSPEEKSEDLMLGLRVGFCGALSSFSSWISAMVGLFRAGQFGQAFVGLGLGVQLPIVAYRFGQHVAVYIFIWRCRRETRRDERRGYGIRLSTDDEDHGVEDDDENENENLGAGSHRGSTRTKGRRTVQEEESETPSVRAISTALFMMCFVAQVTSLTFFQSAEDRLVTLSLLFSPLGVLARWRLLKFNDWRPSFPIGTFACNISACALSGTLGSLLAGNPGESERIFLVSLIAGFGGTLSSVARFIVEILAGMDPILFRMDGMYYAVMSVVWGLVISFLFSASADWADATASSTTEDD